MILLKVTNNQGFIISLENTILEKPQREGQKDPPAVLGLMISLISLMIWLVNNFFMG